MNNGEEMVVSNGRVIHLAPRCLRCDSSTIPGESLCATCQWELRQGDDHA